MCETRAAPVVAIDVGTTNLRVGVWQNDRVEIIPNSQGAYSTPAYVAFTASECLVGEAAELQATRNAANTIFSVNRLIGRKFSDGKLQEDVKYWPFAVVEGPDDTPQIKVESEGNTITVEPVEILAILLSEMREAAEVYLDQKVKDVVLSVPASFDYCQRQVMRDAAAIAELNVLRFMNGSTAASIAHGINSTEIGPRNVLVFDCGGGTLDVSLVVIEEGIFEVLSTAGDAHLGGADIDNLLLEYVLGVLKIRCRQELTGDDRAIIRLREACEQAKRVLFASVEAHIELDALCEGVDFKSTITREIFEFLCGPLFRKMLYLVEKVLRDAKMSKTMVHEVVAVGGLTHIPKVQQILTNYFEGKTLSKPIRPDEANVKGITVQTAVLSMVSSPKVENYLLLDVTPLALGVGIDGGNSVMIPRNKSLPTKKTQTFSALKTKRIQVLEGESDSFACTLRASRVLCEVDFTAINDEEVTVEISFDVNVNGILQVTVVDETTREMKQVTIESGRLPALQIDRMKGDIKSYREIGVRNKQRAESKIALENYVYSVRNNLNTRTIELKRSIEVIQAAEHETTETLHWLLTNRSADKEEFDAKRQKLEEVVNSIDIQSNTRATEAA